MGIETTTTRWSVVRRWGRSATVLLTFAVVVPAVLFGVAGTLVLAQGGPFSRRRDDTGDRARAARDAAADAFLEADRAQQFAQLRAQAFANLEHGAAGQRLLAEFGQVNAWADNAAAAYIGTLDRFNVDAELDAGAMRAAEGAFGELVPRLGQARQYLEAFLSRHAEEFQRLDAAFATLPADVAAADRLLTAAREAVAGATAAGLRPHDAEVALRRAEQARVEVTDGAARHGLAATRNYLEQVRIAAEQARRGADELPARAQHVRQRVSSVRTRTQAVETKLSTVQQTMSELRRQYVAACLRDVEDADTVMRAGLERARAQLREAERYAADDQQRWAEAESALAAASTTLAAADEKASAVVERRRLLAAVAADPSVETDKTWFAVKDAQRLLMSGGGAPGSRFVQALDALVARTEQVGSTLATGSHPDYWAFVAENRAIRDAAARVVEDIRTDRAHAAPR